MDVLQLSNFLLPMLSAAGKPVNLADGEGMQVPCRLELEGQGRYIDICIGL